MKKTVLFPAVFLSVSSVGLVSEIFEKTKIDLPPAKIESVEAPAPTEFANPEEGTFEEFLALFPKKDLPFEVTKEVLMARLVQADPPDDIEPVSDKNLSKEGMAVEEERQEEAWKRRNMIQRLMYQFIQGDENSRFSRIPIYYEPEAVVANAQFTAVIFTSKRGFSGDFANYMVATFDKTGKQIALNTVGEAYPLSVVSFKIDGSLQVSKTEYAVKWKRDYQKHGLKKNKIESLDLVETASVDLTEKQDFEKPRRSKKELLKPAPVEVETEAKKTEVEG